eukprot:CAMPEP_0197848998 /NCGR_PEP_ID=MMETSP1438-20131217/10585_1 /TAXON_ID=1461541 /ORGANISM="Pterosperma sp., Strain CCMP1384" /LENGTH=223 /DNA_ID=CAMNT_0043461491 /DNA_START=137 /DNA_END=805 /DNA_ORIENTATION=-
MFTGQVSGKRRSYDDMDAEDDNAAPRLKHKIRRTCLERVQQAKGSFLTQYRQQRVCGDPQAALAASLNQIISEEVHKAQTVTTGAAAVPAPSQPSTSHQQGQTVSFIRREDTSHALQAPGPSQVGDTRCQLEGEEWRFDNDDHMDLLLEMQQSLDEDLRREEAALLQDYEELQRLEEQKVIHAVDDYYDLQQARAGGDEAVGGMASYGQVDVRVPCPVCKSNW